MNKKVIFISECLLNQNIRAYGVGNKSGNGPLKEILELLIKHDVGINIVPCPEIPYEGLKRFACGRSRYENNNYRNICFNLAQDFIDKYKLYLDDNYKILGFICVNGSPSCAIDYCYDGMDGQVKCLKSGIFIEEIQKKLQENSLDINFIGVRIKDLNIILDKIEKLILENI